MEDAATAEISRTQIWQWLHNKNVKLEDGRMLNGSLYETLVPLATDRIRKSIGDSEYRNGKYDEAFMLFNRMVNAKVLPEFITTSAYSSLD